MEFGELLDGCCCPVCLEIPRQEIFQCENGHLICDLCITPLTTCPQCRVPYQSPRMRNRALEQVLDHIPFPCKYLSEGCNSSQNRCDILLHETNCFYGGCRLKLCCLLGYPCTAELNPRGFDQTIRHIISEHNAVEIPFTNSLELRLFGTADHMKNVQNGIVVPQKTTWRSIIWKVPLTDVKSLMAVSTYVNVDYIVIDVLILRSDNVQSGRRRELQVVFTVPQIENANSSKVKWIQQATPLSRFDGRIISKSVLIPLNYASQDILSKSDLYIQADHFGSSSAPIPFVMFPVPEVSLQSEKPKASTRGFSLIWYMMRRALIAYLLYYFYVNIYSCFVSPQPKTFLEHCMNYFS